MHRRLRRTQEKSNYTDTAAIKPGGVAAVRSAPRTTKGVGSAILVAADCAFVNAAGT